MESLIETVENDGSEERKLPANVEEVFEEGSHGHENADSSPAQSASGSASVDYVSTCREKETKVLHVYLFVLVLGYATDTCSRMLLGDR